ncbi:MAG: GxxExxY protein [Saprospiraceae bacterium]|nr:GxxExxY protein [Saprospiraceae bacterium]
MELKYKEITERIIGAAFEVHKFLGNGFQACLPKGNMARRLEVIYQRDLAWEMSQVDLTFKREMEQDIFYKELREPIGTRRAEFVVEGKVLVELKALKELEDVHLAQALNYLKAYRLGVALLINFGSKSMQFKRMV